MRKQALAMVLFSLISFSCPYYAFAELTAKEIVEKSEKRYEGNDMVGAFGLTLISSQGEVRKRELIRYRKKNEGLWKDLIKFLYPLDIKDTGTLNEEVAGHDDTQYLYLPAAKKLRRVLGKSQSWVGTDLNYEDIQAFKVDDWNYEMVGSEDIDGYPTYVVAAKIKDDSNSIYSKRIFWIRKDGGFFPAKYEVYDKDGKLLKVVLRSEVSDLGNGALYAKYMKVENVQEHHKTEFERHWIIINTDMPDDVLTTRQLEKSIESYSHPSNLKELQQKFPKSS